MVEAAGSKKKKEEKTQYQVFSPTTSIFPHTTLANVKIPIRVFQSAQALRVYQSSPKHPVPPTDSFFYDTPGVEGDSAYLNSFLDNDYQRAISLYKVSGFQRPPDSLRQGPPLQNLRSSCVGVDSC